MQGPAPISRSQTYPIIVHSHLAWDWVWQRPQQFLSRLSRRHRILFVEGPCADASIRQPRVVLREIADYPNIVVVRSHVPAHCWHDGDWVDRVRRQIVDEVLAGPLGAEFENPVQWFYDPMAVTAFGGTMGERAIVYDCMDQLSQFKGAPPALVKRERELLSMADVVFAGGPKIHQAKRAHNSNCHCFGCGVDVEHFAKARDYETPAASDVSHLEGPVLGFFGVVDERMDYELIARLADAEAWNVVIVGPRAKVEESVLPRRANIHWLGGRDYSQLPGYARRFDVCLMPFALNEATEYINPTKALEYMAAGKPIVSTAIDDVVLQFRHVVDIADAHDEFIAMCRRAVTNPKLLQIQRGVELANNNTWEAIVARLRQHIDNALETKEAEADSVETADSAA